VQGSLRIYRTESFDPGYVDRFRMLESNAEPVFHFLISDGIMVDFRTAFMPETLESMRIQRILTSYQLQRILMESDDYPYFIAVMSHSISDWKTAILQSILDVLRIKTYYRGCRIDMNIIGDRDIHELYMGSTKVAGKTAQRDRGIYRWDELH
jgi:hypothetical protein